MEKQREIPLPGKSKIAKVKAQDPPASSCCAPKSTGSICCTPSETPADNGGACCAQPDDGSACCDK